MALYARRPSRAPAAQSHIEMPKRDITRALRIWGCFLGGLLGGDLVWRSALAGNTRL
jgi:predicted lipid-binding transport protein (Tim44 family)